MSSTKYLHILYDKDFDEINFCNECYLTKSPSCYSYFLLDSNFIKNRTIYIELVNSALEETKKVSLLICMKLSLP